MPIRRCNEGAKVSLTNELLPEPLTPVTTTSLSLGISTSMFCRLCSRAPRTDIDFIYRVRTLVWDGLLIEACLHKAC